MRRRTLLVTAALLATACGSVPDDATVLPPDDGTSVEEQPSDEAPGTSEAPPVGAEEAAIFLATVTGRLEGTDYEGLPDADPEGFVATGEIMCDLLTDGATVDDVLELYLAELDAVRDGDVADDARLSGAILGAAVGALCTEHAELVDQEADG